MLFIHIMWCALLEFPFRQGDGREKCVGFFRRVVDFREVEFVCQGECFLIYAFPSDDEDFLGRVEQSDSLFERSRDEAALGTIVLAARDDDVGPVRERASAQVFRFQRRKRAPEEDQGNVPAGLQAGDRWHRNCAGRLNSAPGRALQYPGREDARRRRNTGNE